MGLRTSLSRAAVSAALLLAAACEGSSRIGGVGGPNAGRYPGFDIGVYPGDAALAAWRFPTSPYYWVGYYLAAPCHRDESWMGTRERVAGQGWGTAVLYVGQQDWNHIPSQAQVAARIAAPLQRSGTLAVTCSASLLSTSQGASEAADAIAKATSEGFPAGSTIFLDVEFVTSVTEELRTYVASWIDAVLADGRYRPGIYCAKANMFVLSQTARDIYFAAGRTDRPAFWISSSFGFSIDRAPSDVGLLLATVWQGRFDVTETWGGVARTIDVDVASTPSPSAPPTTTP